MDHSDSSAIATSGAVAAAVSLTWTYVAAMGPMMLAVALAMTWGDDVDNHERNDSPDTAAAGPTAAETERTDVEH